MAFPVVRDGVWQRPCARPAEQLARQGGIAHDGLRLVVPFSREVEAQLRGADPEAVAEDRRGGLDEVSHPDALTGAEVQDLPGGQAMPGPEEAREEAPRVGGVDEVPALEAVREAGRRASESGVEERRREPLRRLARAEEREGAHVQDLAAA